MGAFVPNTPTVTLLVALLSASMWPVAYLINDARFDYAAVEWGQVLMWPVLNYMMAVVAWQVSRWTYGTTRHAHAAEDVGNYRLLAPLGEGGMGEVWRATHRMLARSAAIKFVRPESVAGIGARQSEAFIKRFRREANAIAGLQSPHTVYLYDFGVAEDGRVYYVMELLDGISLQTLVTTFGPQPAARVVAILDQACESLDEAHAHALVHRDLKPSNLMVCRVARTYDVVKVLDFGLAKSLERTDETQLTVAGTATGTPGYMAPEVVMGEPIDARADLYALGCVAYFLLTGTQVFEDPNPTNLAFKHVQMTPDPPSTRTELPIPPTLERIVLACLAKRPAERPESAAALRVALRACDAGIWSDDDAAGWWHSHLPSTSSLRKAVRAVPESTTLGRVSSP
jgi:serine/threonine-protein kinase